MTGCTISDELPHPNVDPVTAALNRVYAEIDDVPDPGLMAAALETLRRGEWSTDDDRDID